MQTAFLYFIDFIPETILKTDLTITFLLTSDVFFFE